MEKSELPATCVLPTLQEFPDDNIHDAATPRLTARKFMVLFAMSILWIASQIPLYLYGAVIPILIADLGGADRYVWITLSNFIPLAAITPFVGQLSDLFGRRNLSLFAAALLVIGNIVCGTSHTMNIFIAGMAIMGCGAGVLELTALAVAGEMAPTQKRGIYVGCIIMTVIPYAPSVLYAQWVAVYSWRWLALWIGGWSFVGLILTAIFFFPPKKEREAELHWRQALSQIDFIGGLLSTAGFTLFLAGLTWGGQNPWTSPRVLVPFFLGLFFLVAFGLWEKHGALSPMFPSRLKQNPRALFSVLGVTAVAGAVFFTVLLCWPSEYSYVYAINGDPVSIGLGSLPIAFCFLGGSGIAAFLLSYFKTHVKLILVIACICMTAGNGALAAARIDNLNVMFLPLVLTCLGCGAVIVPCQIIVTIVCPDDLIATAIALTIMIRFVGGAIGYAIYVSIQTQKFSETSLAFIVPAASQVGITDPNVIQQIILLVASNLGEQVKGLVQTEQQWEALMYAGREAFAASYSYVYYCAIAFGVIATAAASFLPDISALMDHHIAVQY
ncbi:MFS multidrug transporter-like protein [Jackrogersella minutella]|nr:MFS multidrug transporter-like protein [Jackrogersella minutella]